MGDGILEVEFIGWLETYWGVKLGTKEYNYLDLDDYVTHVNRSLCHPQNQSIFTEAFLLHIKYNVSAVDT